MIEVSPDPLRAVTGFAAKHGLGFTLLADSEHAVADAYGTWVEKQMAGKTYWGVQRATFIVGPDGRIARVLPKVSPKTHDEVVLAALAELAGEPRARLGVPPTEVVNAADRRPVAE